jgi:hypothetical protein
MEKTFTGEKIVGMEKLPLPNPLCLKLVEVNLNGDDFAGAPARQHFKDYARHFNIRHSSGVMAF